MEVGLDGNILTRSYKHFGDLASHSWFKVLWQYSSLYKVKIEFNHKYLLGPTHQGDKPLIELFIEHGYKGVVLECLNRVRKFHCVHSLADILCVDGHNVDPAIFLTMPGHSLRIFSWEQPTKADFDAWKHAIRAITSSTLTYNPPLGKYKAKPHIPYQWLASHDATFPYHFFPNGGYDFFEPDSSTRSTRSGAKYKKKGTAPGFPPAAHYASIRSYTTPMFQQPSITHPHSLTTSTLLP
jgi:hypothetical protein